ncbi:cytidine deaminase [Alteromonas sp. ASW11-36]|uniref:Cytidine deaminase n=1 Tax=Alteromonas arenosi TaxID=3055817 RepID=A0ABT7T071_9ALTE|nr:cytidine deaminase [Alteromonas sp. ASW11-36]MDM7861212.1 cytidine deaminase [Alteromonas sp. ASW11-36]
MTIQVTPEVQAAYNKSLDTRANAYAPYSKFQVGAAVKFKDFDQVFYGCNVENASYGATICAERNAIWGAVASIGKQNLEYLIVTTDQEEPAPPCALCLQVLSEFYDPEMPIYLANLQGIQSQLLLKDILPIPFNSFEV